MSVSYFCRRHSIKSHDDYVTAERLELLGLVYEFRLSGQIDRANRLDVLVDKYMTGVFQFPLA